MPNERTILAYTRPARTRLRAKRVSAPLLFMAMLGCNWDESSVPIS